LAHDKTASVDLGLEKKSKPRAHRNMLVAEQKGCRDEKKLKDYAEAIRESNDVFAALELGDEKAWTVADTFFRHAPQSLDFGPEIEVNGGPWKADYDHNTWNNCT
jgi:hypothetical protein